MPRERRGMIPGIHVIQDNTNDTKTGEPERPEFMPWGSIGAWPSPLMCIVHN